VTYYINLLQWTVLAVLLCGSSLLVAAYSSTWNRVGNIVRIIMCMAPRVAMCYIFPFVFSAHLYMSLLLNLMMRVRASLTLDSFFTFPLFHTTEHPRHVIGI